MNVVDIVHSFVALLVCGSAFAWGVGDWLKAERRAAMYCWYAHAFSAFAIVAVYKFYYGGGDLIAYHSYGGFLHEYAAYDPARHLPQLIRLLFHQPHELPQETYGDGTSTGSMLAVAAFTHFVTGSLWAASIIVSTLAAAGQTCLWAGIKRLVPEERRPTALWCTLLVPSVVFWSSSFQKEAFALMGIGVFVLGAARLKTARSVVGAPPLVLGAVVIGLFKAYILFPLAVAGGTYYYWNRAAATGGVRMRPLTFLLGGAATAGVLVLLGSLFPRYAVDTVTQSIEQQQSASLTSAGGSDFREDDGRGSESGSERGTARLLLDAPFTVMTSLFRPFVFESRSAMMLLNSLETSVVLYFLVMAFVRVGPKTLARWVWRSPDLMASLVFVLFFALAVGLATTNLGTLSRYRLPMMPFYFYLVFSASALARTASAKQRQLPGASLSAVGGANRARGEVRVAILDRSAGGL